MTLLNEFFNTFPHNIPTLYFLKRSVNQRFSELFREYKMGTLGTNGLEPTSTYSNLRLFEFVIC